MLVAHAVNFLSAMWFSTRIWRRERTQFALIVGILTMMTESVVAFWSPMLSLTVPLWFVLTVFIWRKWSLLKENRAANTSLRRILDEIILEMRAGKAFRPALAQSLSSFGGAQVASQIDLWLQARSVGLKLDSGPRWWLPIQLELDALDRQSHQAVVRVQQWRLRLKLESDFRRRCGQIVAQVRLQALILTGIYLALLVFALKSGLLNSEPLLIVVSLALFLIGLALIFRMGGRLRWNF